MRRRRVDVLVPEVVVQAVTLGDDADEEVPGLVAHQLEVRPPARLERRLEVGEEVLGTLVGVHVVDVDPIAAGREARQQLGG